MADAATTPSYVTVTPLNSATFTWVPSTSDPRAPQKVASAIDRISACWFSAGTFSIDLQFNDNKPHVTALYLFDYDTFAGGRAERVDVLDSANNLLDTRSASNFTNGQYLVWNLSGHVILRITNTKSVGNAVVSALLFGPAGAAPAGVPATVPAPTNLAANAASGQVSLSWTSGGGVTAGFKVLRNGNQLGVTAATSYVDNTVAGGDGLHLRRGRCRRKRQLVVHHYRAGHYTHTFACVEHAADGKFDKSLAGRRIFPGFHRYFV